MAGNAANRYAAGVPAYTVTTASYTQPAVNANVQISVGNTAWIVVGQVVFIQTGGYYTVVSVDSAVLVTVKNLGYTGNAAVSSSVPTARGVTPGGLQGTAGSGGGWTSVYDVDFTAQSSQSISGSTVTIDGKVWTVTNNASMGGSVVNGTGLVFTPTIGANTATGMLIKLSDLVGSGFDPTALRLRSRMTRTGSPGSGPNYTLFWIQWDNTLVLAANNNRTVVGHESESNSLRIEYFPYGSGTQTNPQTNDNTDDAFMMRWDGGGQVSMSSGVYSAGWPNISAMRLRGLDSGISPVFSYSPPVRPGDFAIGWFIYSGAGPTMTETITRLTVEAL